MAVLLYEAQVAMETERKVSHAKHISDLDRACAKLAGSNAYACEAGLVFDEQLKECQGGKCKEGKHTFYAIVERIYWLVVDALKSEPSASWRDIAMRYTSDADIINRLSWSFL